MKIKTMIPKFPWDRAYPQLFRNAFMLIFIAGLFSCQKVINLDLNSTLPQLVVEANISDQPGPYFVRLTKTVNFTEITSVPTVDGAIVEIADSTSGFHEILTGSGNGIYSTSLLRGIPGHRYKLTITTPDGQVYEAVSDMPYPAVITRLTISRETEPSSPFGGGDQPSVQYRVNYEINDPPEYANYYRFVIYRKNREISSRRVFDDEYHNGKLIEDDFVLHDSIDFNPGDTVRIELRNIDKHAYDFFRTLRAGVIGLTFLSASPSNPVSNVTNNGLGYFSASSLSEGFVVIPGN